MTLISNSGRGTPAANVGLRQRRPPSSFHRSKYRTAHDRPRASEGRRRHPTRSATCRWTPERRPRKPRAGPTRSTYTRPIARRGKSGSGPHCIRCAGVWGRLSLTVERQHPHVALGRLLEAGVGQHPAIRRPRLRVLGMLGVQQQRLGASPACRLLGIDPESHPCWTRRRPECRRATRPVRTRRRPRR